jgi:hypothetical protein
MKQTTNLKLIEKWIKQKAGFYKESYQFLSSADRQKWNLSSWVEFSQKTNSNIETENIKEKGAWKIKVKNLP